MKTQAYELTASEMVGGFSGGTLSPVEAIDSVLTRSDAKNPDINALIFIDPDRARADARESEERWRRGEPLGPLDGVPVTIKDSIAEATRPMVRGLKANLGKGPVGYDAPPTKRLKETGAVIFAKTTMPDFGLLASGVSSAFGITRNPWNLDCNPGGSSSGAAAALAARCGPLAVGSDIGGSVRIPAAYCGLVGLKPSQGRIPHTPPSAVRSAGPLARTTRDAALLLTTLARPDSRDYGSLPPDPTQYQSHLDFDVGGLTIGLTLEGDNGAPPEPAVAAAVESAALALENAGAKVRLLPSVVGADFMQTVSILFLIRGFTEFQHLPESARGSIPDHFAQWFDKMPGYSAIDVGNSMDQLEKIKARVLAQMAEVDFLLSPVTAAATFPADALQAEAKDGGSPLYSPIWNQTGNPAASIPCGFDSETGVPIGLQVVGQRFDDLGVLRLCAAYERLRDFEMVWPA